MTETPKHYFEEVDIQTKGERPIMSDKISNLHDHFNDQFINKMKDPESKAEFLKKIENLVLVHWVSLDFIKKMEENDVFKWHDIVDIIHPETVSVMKKESDKLYTRTPEVRKSIMDISLNK